MVVLIGSLTSCTPDKYEFQEMEPVDMQVIREIKLRTSHFQLLADGKAQLEFNPLLITEDGFEVEDSRVDHSQIEYRTESGEKLPKLFSTTDQSLIGKSVKVQAKITGTDLISNTVTFTVEDPSVIDKYPEITIPIIFHLIQANSDITEYGGEIPMERIHLLLEKMNNTFSGSVSNNAMGVDTRIRFQAAIYDPNGNKLREPGINRVYVDKVADQSKDKYNTFLAKQNALWPYDKYLNIWLVSDRNNEYFTFYHTVSKTCIPRYLNTGTNSGEIPQGLNLSVPLASWNPKANEIGILYKLQSIQSMVRTFGENKENELINGVGYYLGLLPTWTAKRGYEPQDYCPDTHKYFGTTVDKINHTAYKLIGDCFFLAENIMDDPVGVHRSVSLQQALRIHWVLNNCPERSAWKSDYAFTGK